MIKEARFDLHDAGLGVETANFSTHETDNLSKSLKEKLYLFISEPLDKCVSHSMATKVLDRMPPLPCYILMILT